jgi:hypothetical protein
MQDKELLELSAKAYGCEGLDYRHGSDTFYYDDPESGRECWFPIGDYSQSLKLAIRLMFKIDIRKTSVTVEPHVFNESSKSTIEFFEDNEDLRSVAVCRAIVRAAAEIGKSMQ